MSNEMMERVARAIRLLPGCPEHNAWAEVAARAAIGAMREPTEAMKRAGTTHSLSSTLSGGNTWPDYVADIYRVQIDVVLEQ